VEAVTTLSDDRHASFVFAGHIRHESARGLLIQPRDFGLPRTAAEWLPRRLVRVLGARDSAGFVEVSVPLWLARQKFPEDALAEGGEVRVRPAA
jgi:hypothetical protein